MYSGFPGTGIAQGTLAEGLEIERSYKKKKWKLPKINKKLIKITLISEASFFMDSL